MKSAVLIFAVGLSAAFWPATGVSAPAPAASPSPSHSASAGVAPPTPSAPKDSPLGTIGALERNRSTEPSKFAAFLDGADPALAMRAAIAIGRLRNMQGVSLLTAALSNMQKPEEVRAAAAFALGVIASADAVPALDAAIGQAPRVAGAVADSLGRIGGDNVVDPLIRALGSRDRFVRGKAAIGLAQAAFASKAALSGSRRDRAARALSAAVALERDSETRWRMAWAIGRAYYVGNTGTLRRMLTDPEELVRIFAIKGIARLKDRSLALPVRLLRTDKSWRVRVEVRDALAKLGDRTSVETKPSPISKADLVEPKALSTSAPFGDHPQIAMVTNRGTIVLELFPDQAPYNVDNFLTLVDRGFYNGLAFFRVIQNFVIQAGDPRNDGNGGPGYTVPAELNPLEQLTGMIALGLDYDEKRNVPLVDSGGSQFYITESPQLHLDEGFSTFGRVVKGMSVVWAITPHDPKDKAKGADTIVKAYRCEAVTPQTADAERKLRTAEIDYNAR